MRAAQAYGDRVPLSLCVVHNNVDDRSAIGRIARWAARTGLEAGWRVSVVARDLDPALHGEVEWLRLYVPPRLHLVQWLAARSTIRRALRGRRFDVVQVYQPQVAALADVWHCQYLSREAWATGSVPRGGDARAVVQRTELRGVLAAEDAYLRRLGAGTLVAFCSHELRRAYHRHYGAPPREAVLPNPGPAPVTVTAAERDAARQALVPHAGRRLVVGYLGGVDDRKGYRELCDAVAADDRLVLMFAGPRSERFTDRRLGDRLRVLGNLADVGPFFAAIDVLAVPSRFEPYGVVVNEAAAHGVPVLVTPNVGCAGDVLAAGFGGSWSPGEPLHDRAAALVASGCGALGRPFAAQRSEAGLAADLRAVWESVLGASRMAGAG